MKKFAVDVSNDPKQQAREKREAIAAAHDRARDLGHTPSLADAHVADIEHARATAEPDAKAEVAAKKTLDAARVALTHALSVGHSGTSQLAKFRAAEVAWVAAGGGL